MCRLLCLLLVWHCRFIVTCLPPTWLFALPGDMEAGFFFFGKALSDVVAICTSWCQWYEEVVHGSVGCRASSAIYLGLYFHCASHAACTHTPFQKLAIALAIGFSSESVLKYERLTDIKKETWVNDGVKVARNEVENASFAQRSAHRDSRIWRPELIEPAAEHKRRARGRRPTFKSAYPDPQILPQCNISSNYPL